MRHIALALTMLGALSVVTASGLAEERAPGPTTATQLATAADQAVVIPVRWYVSRPYPGWYAPRYYGPYYTYRPYDGW